MQISTLNNTSISFLSAPYGVEETIRVYWWLIFNSIFYVCHLRQYIWRKFTNLSSRHRLYDCKYHSLSNDNFVQASISKKKRDINCSYSLKQLWSWTIHRFIITGFCRFFCSRGLTCTCSLYVQYSRRNRNYLVMMMMLNQSVNQSVMCVTMQADGL